jgi:hypothetical protein
MPRRHRNIRSYTGDDRDALIFDAIMAMVEGHRDLCAKSDRLEAEVHSIKNLVTDYLRRKLDREKYVPKSARRKSVR